MVTQSSLNFEASSEVKTSQPQIQNVPIEPILVKATNKQVRETTIDKFKAKKFITLNDIYNQLDAVLYHLQQEGSITSMQAFSEWHITRLSAIIWTLRKKYNINIEGEDLEIINKFGHPTTFSKYKLQKSIPVSSDKV